MSYVESPGIFYKSSEYKTRLIDLQSDFEQDYKRRLRRYFQHSEISNFIIERPSTILDLISRYQQVVDSKGLNPLFEQNLKSASNYFYSTIRHPQLGNLAAHLNIGDQDENRVFGYVNASSFRSFKNPADQQLCSIANKYLYDQDMLYFKTLRYNHFDMVGTKEPMNQMKKQFGGEILETYNHVPYIIYALKKLVKNR